MSGLAIEAMPRRLFASLDVGTAAAAATGLRSVTDASGHFNFERVADGEYEVRTAETAFYKRARAALRAGQDSAVLVVEARSERTVHVHGVVADTRGGPLKDVRVELVGRPATAAVSGESGDTRCACPPQHPGRMSRCASHARVIASSACPSAPARRRPETWCATSPSNPRERRPRSTAW